MDPACRGSGHWLAGQRRHVVGGRGAPGGAAEFGATRGTASLAFTMMMLGFGLGGVLTGKITDRYGIVTAIGLGIGILGLGYIGAGMSSSICNSSSCISPLASVRRRPSAP